MDNPEVRLAAARAARVQVIIWAAFLLAVAVYFLLTFLLTRQGPKPVLRRDQLSMLRVICYALGAGLLVASVLVRRLLDQRSYQYADEAIRGTLLALIVGLALAESASILGLMLIFLGGGWSDAIPFLVAGFVAVLLQRPDPNRLAERIQALRSR